ncbi:outer membrane beta-barrel protein [Shewanella atlantica]|uniref:Outer membrane protein OmpA-like transmembrane domain-containing protein n=1 Tax=Shewanella atlantica TaxID=271099 RepID=A0A431VSJ2_9GAMM|nr:outer membrane beta-barrel protein [Shewanella atlantica]RTR26073.1 hypothetical protein EKG39_22400 [Shewanella atlantica]
MKQIIMLGMVAVSYSSGTPAVVAEDAWYLGARAGVSHYQGACKVEALECDDNGFAYGLYGGYQFNSWFGVEIGVTDYGSPSGLYTDSPTELDTWGGELSGCFVIN